MKGVASACASVTVVNAMATWKGAAFGVELRLRAEVELLPDRREIEVEIVGMKEDPSLVRICVQKVLKKFGETKYGARIRTLSEIPVAVGLSSSSAAANAAVLATFAALGKNPRPREVLNIGIDAAFEAGVTLTGAFDDAAASFFGHGVITDNRKRKILREFRIPKGYSIVILVPPTKLYTKDVNREVLGKIKEFAETAHKQALRGNIFGAMILNGLLYMAAFGYDPQPVFEAMSAGAIAAGLTGKGPAVAAIVPEECADSVAKVWKTRGKILVTRPSEDGARIE